MKKPQDFTDLNKISDITTEESRDNLVLISWFNSFLGF
jgi:hypothetical protein